MAGAWWSQGSSGGLLPSSLLSLRYHMECLEPPLQEVPVDEWFCPECAASGAASAAAGNPLPPAPPSGGGGERAVPGRTRGRWVVRGGPRDSPRVLSLALRPGQGLVEGVTQAVFFRDAGPVSEEEVSLLLTDVVPTTSRLRPHAGRTRAIARTRQSERVRATVNRNRISTARRVQVGLRPGGRLGHGCPLQRPSSGEEVRAVGPKRPREAPAVGAAAARPRQPAPGLPRGI